jgi:hypothetical protein
MLSSPEEPPSKPDAQAGPTAKQVVRPADIEHVVASGSANIIRVNPGQVFEATGIQSSASDVTGTQRVGLWLAGALFALILMSLVFTGFTWWYDTPPLPKLPTDPEQAKAVIANHKALVEAAHESSMKLLDATVGKLLALLGTIIGYILGTQVRNSNSS